MTGRGIVRLAAALAIALLGLSGCTAATGGPASSLSATGTTPTNVIDFAGLPGIAIGASRAELTKAGAITTAGPGCGPSFASLPNASPVFDADRLVLIWAYQPLHTPEGVSVGSSIEAARKAYPSAVDLSAPAGSHRYPGLLVTGPDDLTYLMLYDSSQVQKLVVGMQKYARMLVDTGFGAC
jgi:hypothetical protein